MSDFERGDHIRVPIRGGGGSSLTLFIPTPLYAHSEIYHHGIYLGRDSEGTEWVACLVSESPATGRARPLILSVKGGTYKIGKVTLEDFAEKVNADTTDIEKSPRLSAVSKLIKKPYSKEETARRAESRLGETGKYKVLGPSVIDFFSRKSKYTLNCEMFARQCETGESGSGQMADFVYGVGFVFAAGFAVHQLKEAERRYEQKSARRYEL
jgi:hypothetical protein